jgi:hypothetical protein
MRVNALVGAILVMVIPFAYSNFDSNIIKYSVFMGLLYYRFEGQFFIFVGEEAASFQLDWLTPDGVYDFYFGDFWFLGVVALILLIASIVLSVATPEKSTSAILLIIAGSLLLVGRLFELNDNDLSFYDSNNNRTYFEIPIGFILALVFGILDFKKK